MMSHERVLTINSGAVLSDVLALRNLATVAGLVAPVITSCQLFVQMAVASGGPFTRLTAAAGSGDLTWAVGPGSKCWAPGGLTTFPYMRIEASTAQADVRSFQLLLRL